MQMQNLQMKENYYFLKYILNLNINTRYVHLSYET